MHSFRTRLLTGIGANAYSQLVSIVIQVLSLPIFLRSWTLKEYGVWTLISTVPAYFSMADLGIISVAANKMTMARANGDLITANRVFQTAVLFVFLACGGLFALAVTSSIFISEEAYRVDAWKPTLLVLVATALLNLGTGLFEAVFRASLQYAKGTSLLGTARLIEWAGTVVALQFNHGLLSAAVGGLLARVLGSIYIYFYSRRQCSDFRWGTAGASRAELRELVLPAISFMLFPIGTAISMQGMLLVVGATLGPVAVAIFATYRTLSRVVVQAIGIGSHAMGPEFSLLYARREFARLTTSYHKAAWIGYLVSFCASIAIGLVAKPFLSIWTHDKIPFDLTLLSLSILSTFVAGAWHVSRIVLLSTNQHSRISFGFILTCGLSIPLAFVTIELFGLDGAVVSTIFVEAVMFVVARACVNRFLRVSDR